MWRGSGCCLDNRGECAELGRDVHVGRKERRPASRNSHSVNLLHPCTPTHRPQRRPQVSSAFLPLSGLFPLANTHSERLRKWPVWLPNIPMCHDSSSDISAKIKPQEGGRGTAPRLPSPAVPLTHSCRRCDTLQLPRWETLQCWEAMSRCCVVKVIALTEIQISQVGGGVTSAAGQGNQRKIRYSHACVCAPLHSHLYVCVFVQETVSALY